MLTAAAGTDASLLPDPIYGMNVQQLSRGVGQLEAIDEATILALADPDDSNGDGVRGTPNWAINPETGQGQQG